MKVKVRVAVVVTTDGKWYAAGSKGLKEKDSFGTCYDCIDLEAASGGEAEYILTAELDVPEPKTVAAEVERSDGK